MPHTCLDTCQYTCLYTYQYTCLYTCPKPASVHMSHDRVHLAPTSADTRACQCAYAIRCRTRLSSSLVWRRHLHANRDGLRALQRLPRREKKRARPILAARNGRRTLLEGWKSYVRCAMYVSMGAGMGMGMRIDTHTGMRMDARAHKCTSARQSPWSAGAYRRMHGHVYRHVHGHEHRHARTHLYVCRHQGSGGSALAITLIGGIELLEWRATHDRQRATCDAHMLVDM